MITEIDRFLAATRDCRALSLGLPDLPDPAAFVAFANRLGYRFDAGELDRWNRAKLSACRVEEAQPCR